MYRFCLLFFMNCRFSSTVLSGGISSMSRMCRPHLGFGHLILSTDNRLPTLICNKGTKHEVFLLGSLLSFVLCWFSSCGAFGLPETGKVCPSSSISCYHIKNQEIPAILLFFHQARKQAYIYPDMAAQHTLFHSSHKRTLFLLSHQNS